MAIIKRNAGSVYGHEGRLFKPGNNFVPDDEIEKHTKDPYFQKLMKAGLLELVVEQEKDGALTFSEQLANLNAKDAVEIVEGTLDMSLLEQALEDKRKTVRESAEKNIKELKRVPDEKEGQGSATPPPPAPPFDLGHHK